MPAGTAAETSRQTIARDDAPVAEGGPVSPLGAVPEAHRIDAEFLGRSRGNMADYAIRTGKRHHVAARELRNIASISARDPRYICAMDAYAETATATTKSATQVLMGFRTAVATVEAMGATSLPHPMLARVALARRVAMSTQPSMKQVAILSDALAQDLYAAGAPKTAYAFGMVSGQAVDRLTAGRVLFGAHVRKISLR
jgi:hypothetical protein